MKLQPRAVAVAVSNTIQQIPEHYLWTVKIMASKRRRDDDLTSEQPKKLIKIENEYQRNQVIDFDRRKREELENALDTEDNDRVLELGLEFIDWQMTSSKLAKRLQSFFEEKIRNQELVCRLLEHQNPHRWTPEGGVLLWQAVNEGQVDIAEFLVRAGADLRLRDSENHSTILHAVLSSVKIKDQVVKENLVSLMLEYGANVDVVDKSGWSVLHKAIINQFSTSFIKKLLQHGANVRMESINYAIHYKPDLLLTLIQHQVPNEETRNRRGVVAIEYLIAQKGAEKLEMIKDILKLGVPINNPDPTITLGNHACSLLHSALRSKKIDVIKLLLENGADIREKDETGSIPLYEASVTFKGYSHASRLLISHGANINERNSDGKYPIHGACKKESLRNVHLLLSLGASLAVTDNKGHTPFSSMSLRNVSLSDAGRLVIKHFALMTSKGIPLIESDLKRIDEYNDVRGFYNSCLKELENMKTVIVCDGFPYHSILSDNVRDRLLLVENANFVKTFNENGKKICQLFPIYIFNLKISFAIAVKQYEIFDSTKKVVENAFKKLFPVDAIEKIAYYVSLEKMTDCEKSSYLSLHQNAKHSRVGKRMLI